MQLKIFVLSALWLASYVAAENPDTPNVIAANWTFVSTKVNDLSLCCQPTGNLSIIGNPNYTITLTSTNWTGGYCDSNRNSSFQDVINIDWTYSFDQMQVSYDNGHFLPVVTDNNGTNILFDLIFTGDPTQLSLVYNIQYQEECYSLFAKSGSIMTIFAVVLIGFANLIIA